MTSESPDKRIVVMSQIVRAIYENGVLRPLDYLNLQEHEEVRVTVEADMQRAVEDASQTSLDPFEGIRLSTGIPDLAQHFDDYRFGRRQR